MCGWSLLVVVCCVLFVVCWLFVVHCFLLWLLDVCGLVLVVVSRVFLFVVCCVLFGVFDVVVRCRFVVGCCLLCTVSC